MALSTFGALNDVITISNKVTIATLLQDTKFFELLVLRRSHYTCVCTMGDFQQ